MCETPSGFLNSQLHQVIFVVFHELGQIFDNLVLKLILFALYKIIGDLFSVPCENKQEYHILLLL